tara:strand:- start:6337 stop:7746 length:1410 start_codon:yes stop_codon:yes gene_type:complete
MKPLFFFFLLSTLAISSERPNILFLLADDMRPDAIRALGNSRIQTPNLDELVRRGTTFTQATCSYPICVVSRAEILTGMHGWENGIDGITNRFNEGVTFWAQTLADAGYRTSYVGKWHTKGRPSERGYDEVFGLFSGGGGKWWKERQTDWKGFPITGYRGWVFQSDDGREKFPEKGVGLTPDIDSKFADAAIEAIQAASPKPWFVHVNFTAPHDPLFLPPGMETLYRADEMEIPPNFLPEHPFDHGNFSGRDESLMAFPRTEAATRDVLRVYYAVISYLDAQVGRILKVLDESGQRENTVVIFASDHGMAVGSHGLRGKQNMYEHTVNVPLVIAGPEIKAHARSLAQVYLRDLYPTTCELAGVPIPGAVTAKSFAASLRRGDEPLREEIFGYFRDSQRMIRSDGWKLIVYPLADKTQLFDLKSDPWETRNLADSPQALEIRQHLETRLNSWRQNQGDPLLQSSGEGPEN